MVECFGKQITPANVVAKLQNPAPKLNDFVTKVVDKQDGKLTVFQKIAHPKMSGKYTKAFISETNDQLISIEKEGKISLAYVVDGEGARKLDLDKKGQVQVVGVRMHGGVIEIKGTVPSNDRGLVMQGGYITINGQIAVLTDKEDVIEFFAKPPQTLVEKLEQNQFTVKGNKAIRNQGYNETRPVDLKELAKNEAGETIGTISARLIPLRIENYINGFLNLIYGGHWDPCRPNPAPSDLGTKAPGV